MFWCLKSVRLAQHFEALVRSDNRFEIPAERHLGMVVFRLTVRRSILETDFTILTFLLVA